MYPHDRGLPEDLVERLFATYQKRQWHLPCVDAGPRCEALLIDLDGDAREEAVVLAALGGVVWVYAQRPAGWTLVGRLMAERSLEGPESLLKALAERRWRTVPPAYLGLEIGTRRYTFQPEPCETGEAGCP